MIDLDGLLIPILGRDVVVFEVSDDDMVQDDLNDGLFCHETFIISIRKSITNDDYKMRCLAHELGHAFIYRAGLCDSLDDKSEECLAECIGNLLIESFGVDKKWVKSLHRIQELLK